jgi:hypothetical protein
MERASAYWELAHRPEEDREAGLLAIAAQFGRSAKEREALNNEGQSMLKRFDDLFPAR